MVGALVRAPAVSPQRDELAHLGIERAHHDDAILSKLCKRILQGTKTNTPCFKSEARPVLPRSQVLVSFVSYFFFWGGGGGVISTTHASLLPL